MKVTDKIQALKGDCLQVMRTIEDNSVDAIITDPPYGTTACKWDSVIPFYKMWKQLNRIIKPNGAIVLFGSEPFSSALRMSNIKNYKYDWKWDKVVGSNFVNAKKMPLKVYEDIMIFYNKQPTYNPIMMIRDKENHRVSGKSNNKTNNINNIAQFSNIKSKKYKYPTNKIEINRLKNEINSKHSVHPTQKPVALMEYLIKTYTNEDDLVLDFTMGSGSTMVACQNTNRKGIGIEMNEEYFQIAIERIKNHVSQLRIY
jgi:site-specific DNA-methyltransferase (adenine-specific)